MKQFIAIMAIASIGFASCATSADRQKQADLEAQVQSLEMEMAKKQIVDSMSEMAKLQVNMPAPMPEQVAVAAAPAPKPKVVYRTRTVVKRVPVHHYTAPARDYYGDQYAGYNNTPQYASYNQPQYVAQQPVQQRRGWSAKAKGAAIGGGAGALAGALIGQQKGKSALIGGLIGAAGGLGVGALIDNRNGR